LKIGDRERLVGVPANLPQGDASLPTPATFQKCVGREFVIAGFNEMGWAEIDIESVTGSLGETIWIESEFLKLVSK
jgi:hypothetical protein